MDRRTRAPMPSDFSMARKACLMALGADMFVCTGLFVMVLLLVLFREVFVAVLEVLKRFNVLTWYIETMMEMRMMKKEGKVQPMENERVFIVGYQDENLL